MNEEDKISRERKERRDFLRILGGAVALGGATFGLDPLVRAAAAAPDPAPPEPAIPGPDCSPPRAAFGADVNTCIC